MQLKYARIALAGAVGGFTTGAIMTGSLKGALRGALFGGLSAGIAYGIGHGFGANWGDVGQTFAHGVAQGGLSEAFGGDFRSGFIGAFVGHSIGAKLKGWFPNNVVGRTMAAAVTGGVASRLGGGKFANGAISAAFVHLFNEEAKQAISAHTAKELAEKGIEFTLEGADVILTRDALTIARVPKASVGLINIGIKLLDAEAGNGLIQYQVRLNLVEFESTSQFASTEVSINAQNAFADGRYYDVVLMLAEHGYEFKNLSRRLGELSSGTSQHH